jgi:hypothetical protein
MPVETFVRRKVTGCTQLLIVKDAMVLLTDTGTNACSCSMAKPRRADVALFIINLVKT